MKTKYISGLIMAVTLLFVACQPEEFGESDLRLNLTPTAEEMEFTITPGVDAYHYVLENLTPITGIHTVKWNFGNGGTAKGNKVIAYYPLPGDFEVALTITANDGNSAEKTKNLTQTETDYAFLESPLLAAISGGVSLSEGKTWVIDSLSSDHLGVGSASSYDHRDWSASPKEKSGHYIYDDEFTFKLVGFDYNIDTHGSTQANGDGNAAADGLDAGYYTSIIWEDAYDKDVNTNDAARGDLNWSLVAADGKDYITLSSQSGVIGYDDGNPRSYEILEWNENFLFLRTVGGAARYHKLIPKGYVKPTVTYSVDIATTSEENTWSLSLTDVVIPEGLGVSGYKVDFGDGSAVVEVNAYTGTAEHTYMRKGKYPVTVTLMASNEDVVIIDFITVENHHSTYVPFLLDMMVMYVDNSEVAMAPIVGEDCEVTVVENPERTYPNKGVNVFHYRKENQEWANANMMLPAGYRFNLTQNSVFKILVRGKAGQQVLLKLENTDKGGNAWQTGTADLIYTIGADDTWEVAEFDFAGVGAGWDWTGDQFTSDITTDSRFNSNFYNIVRIMLNPGNGEGVHEFYFDDLSGPHVEGLKSARL